MTDFKHALAAALNDIRIELAEEFDRNFERKAFFTKGWQRKAYNNGKSLLLDTGALRRSIRSRLDANGITFSSSLPYAIIHNEGEGITVTPRMKRYFWAMYMKTTGGMTRTQKGTLSKTRHNRQLSDQAAFYKAMALKRAGSKIFIPERRFLGPHSRVDEIVKAILIEHIEQYLDNNLFEHL